jgi:hypothetical protein
MNFLELIEIAGIILGSVGLSYSLFRVIFAD